jgi:hypothetical protein
MGDERCWEIDIALSDFHGLFGCAAGPQLVDRHVVCTVLKLRV